MILDVTRDGVHLGRLIRSAGAVYAYDPTGVPIGNFGDLDAGASALAAHAIRRLAA
ncbi:hypothetical protein ACFZ8E_06230 [Methylobacterium sp. HMF5984]|uniref:hypothetical protein n=1 Tax=Methylobacterium sp. HMF5984 TaxID=3367370 RepID=UPI003851C4D5